MNKNNLLTHIAFNWPGDRDFYYTCAALGLTGAVPRDQKLPPLIPPKKHMRRGVAFYLGFRGPECEFESLGTRWAVFHRGDVTPAQAVRLLDWRRVPSTRPGGVYLCEPVIIEKGSRLLVKWSAGFDC